MEALKHELPELHQHGVRMRFTGDRAALTKTLQEQMAEAEHLTRTNEHLILNIVINYGGKWDIVTAAKKITQEVISGRLKIEAIDEQVFNQFLDTGALPEPDLFIRTSGELRISNFFLWQLAYTELYFTQAHWPDFSQNEFELALEAFSKRRRRFGQISLPS